MGKTFLFIAITLCLLQNAIGQTFGLTGVDCLKANATVEGKKFTDKRYFKSFALLLQDTCSTFNRFTNYFYSDNDLKNNLPQRYYRAVVVDTTLAIMAETSISRLNVDLSRYIRLYAGFINDKNDTCLVVQFLKPKEYKRNKHYSKQLDLIAQKNRQLTFLVLKKKGDELFVEKYFP